MEHLLNLEELAVLLSVAGLAAWLAALRVPPSAPWQESAALRRVLLGLGGAALQAPVALVWIYRPQYVVDVFTVAPFDPARLAVEYAVIGAIAVGVALLARWMD